MANIKYLETALASFHENEAKSVCEDGSMLVSIKTILNALREYEVGIPEEYFERDGVYHGIESWLHDEMKKGNIAFAGSDNTHDLAGKVSVDFGFAQFESSVRDTSFVLMHVHNGQPFLKESCWHNNYPAMLFQFEGGTSFYDVLDQVSFESPDVPSMTISVKDKHYLVLPRAVNESYYVKCLETGEELEPTGDVWFYGNEEEVKEQIESYVGKQKTLLPKPISA